MNLYQTLYYLPPISFYAAAWQKGSMLIDDIPWYEKGSFRNATLIAGPNGKQRLSIPVRKPRKVPYKEIQIAYDMNWPLQHWRSIQTAYGNAPFFEFYADELESHLFRETNFLFDFNINLLNWSLKTLKLNQLPIHFTSAMSSEQLSASENSESVMEALLPSYAQVFEYKHGFLSDLSIVDLIMCMGPEAKHYIARIEWR